MDLKILAHTMEYRGEAVTSPVNLRNYQDSDYEIYKKAYEACFHEMRAALQLLWFAVSYLQKKNCSPILLHVADWNQEAVELYRKNGFVITKTEYV